MPRSPSFSLTLKPGFFLVPTLLLGLVLRILIRLELSEPLHLFRPVLDAKSYLDWARDIAGGNVWGTEVFFQAPLYSYLMGFFFYLANFPQWAWIGIQYFLSLATAVLLYLTARHYFDRKIARISALLTVIYPPLIYYDQLFLKTSLALFACTLFLYVASVHVAGSKRRLPTLLAGLILGLGALAKETLVPFSLVTALFFVWKGRKSLSPKLLTRQLVFFFLGIGLILGPVAYRNYQVSGDFILITAHGGANFFVGNNPAADGTAARPFILRPSPRFEREDFHRRAEEGMGRKLKPSEASNYWLNQGLAFAKHNPTHFLKLTAKKAGMLFSSTEIPDNYNYTRFQAASKILGGIPLSFGLLLALAFVGLFSLKRPRKKLLLFLLFVLVNAGLLMFFHVNSRYRMPIVPPLILFAALGLHQIWLQAIGGPLKKRMQLAMVFFMGLSLAHLPLYQADPSQDLYQAGYSMLEEEQPLQAKALFRESTEKNPKNYLAWTALGFIELNEGNLKRALTHLERALKINPIHTPALNNRGSALARMSRFKEAEKSFQATLKTNPHDHMAKRNLVLLYARQNNLHKALEILDTMPPHDPALQELHHLIQSAAEKK